MKQLEQAIYTPLFEDDVVDVTGWDKETVKYAIKNSKIIKKRIHAEAVRLVKNVDKELVNDIFQEVMLYMYKSDDWNSVKAVEKSSTGKMVDIKGYVNSIVRFCVLRNCVEDYRHKRNKISEVFKDVDDKELSILDTIPDVHSSEAFNVFDFDFETLCRSYEPLRYRFGPDLYLVLYVRILTAENGRYDNVYLNILDVMGISKTDIMNLNSKAEDAAMVNMVSAIKNISASEAISILERYVYSASMVKKTVLSMI